MKYLYPFTNCQDIFLFHDVPRYHWFYASFSIAKVEFKYKNIMSWLLLIDVVFTALYHGLWWIDSVISLALVYFVVKEGFEAIQTARGETDDCDCCK